MKKNTVVNYIILVLAVFYIPISAQIKLPYKIAFTQVHPIGHIEAKDSNDFKTELEMQLNKEKQFFSIISREFDEELLDVIIDKGSDLTTEDLLGFGRQEIFNYIIIPEMSVEEGLFSKKFSATIHIINVESREKFAIVKESNYKSISELAQKIYNQIYKKMCEGKLKIKVDQPDVKCTIKSRTSRQFIMEKKSIAFQTEIGEYYIMLEKQGYRPVDTTLIINPGGSVIFNTQMTLKGTLVSLQGSPEGAVVLIKNNQFEYEDKLPFIKRIPVGRYELTVSAAGYKTHQRPIEIRDINDKRPIQVNLAAISSRVHIKKSLILPGWGQLNLGYPFSAFLFFTAEISTATGGIYWHMKYDQLSNETDDLLERYNQGAVELRDEIEQKEKTRDQYMLLRNTSLGAFIIVYAYNVFDVYRKAGRIQTQKKEPFKPDDSIFDNIGMHYSYERGVAFTWQIDL